MHVHDGLPAWQLAAGEVQGPCTRAEALELEHGHGLWAVQCRTLAKAEKELQVVQSRESRPQGWPTPRATMSYPCRRKLSISSQRCSLDRPPTLSKCSDCRTTAKFLHSRCANAQVLRLQKKLGEAHVSDVGALRRAHASISQHSQALHIEAQACALPASRLSHHFAQRLWVLLVPLLYNLFVTSAHRVRLLCSADFAKFDASRHCSWTRWSLCCISLAQVERVSLRSRLVVVLGWASYWAC